MSEKIDVDGQIKKIEERESNTGHVRVELTVSCYPNNPVKKLRLGGVRIEQEQK